MKARGNSKDSAARFLELRSGRRIPAPRVEFSDIDRAKREAANSRRRIREAKLHNVPMEWKYVESQVAGCWAAWQVQVGLYYDGAWLATTGKPPYVLLIRPSCQTSGQHAINCDCYAFRNGKWLRITGKS